MTQLARLTAAESRAFNKHEATIERGLETFLEVGHALADIRDRRLYRQTHSSFESYCNERWGRGRRWANQLICASVAATHVGNHGSLRPNARQARALAKAPAECQAEVWAEVVDQHGEKVTAAKVIQAVRRITAESQTTLSFGSLCSGIEGAAVALPGWRHSFYAETDPTCCKLLEQKYPRVRNLGDVLKIEKAPRADVLVAGTPCQSFSIAGSRAGMDDVNG